MKLNKSNTNIVITSEAMVYNTLLERNLRKEAPEINVMGMADTLEDLLSILDVNKPDVLLLSLNTKTGYSNDDLYGVIKAKHPNVKIIVSTETYYYECLKIHFMARGAEGFIHVNCFGDNEELLIQAIYRAKKSLKTTCSHEPDSYYHKLSKSTLEFTPEEYKIIPLICAQYSIPKIARVLKTNERNIKRIRRSVFEKTGSNSKLHFYAIALGNGLHRIS